jgi:hypothetical protein
MPRFKTPYFCNNILFYVINNLNKEPIYCIPKIKSIEVKEHHARNEVEPIVITFTDENDMVTSEHSRF